MTVKELIEHLELMNENDNIAYALWTEDDVFTKAKENNEFVTFDEVSEILRRMYKYQDCEYGITWDSLNSHMIDVISERE